MHELVSLGRSLRPRARLWLLLLATLAASTDVLVYFLLARQLGQLDSQLLSFPWFLPAVLALSLNLILAQHRRALVIDLLARRVCHYQQQMVTRLARLSLPALEELEQEGLDPDTLRERLVGDTALINEAAEPLAGILGHLLLAVLYVLMVVHFWPAAGLLVGLLITVGLVLFLANETVLRKAEARYRQAEDQLLGQAAGIVHGRKEIRANQRLRQGLWRHAIQARAHTLQVTRDRAGWWFGISMVALDGLLLLGAALVVFLVQWLDPQPHEILVTAVVLVTTVPLAMLAQFPVLTRTNTALARLNALEQRLVAAPTAPEAGRRVESFQSLVLRGVVYHYPDVAGDSGFQVGPLALRLEAGRLVFLVGGNGSGKSTLGKLLVGLYPPDRGETLLNDEPVEIAAFGEVFGVSFPDSPVLDRLYGLPDIEPARVRALLTRFGLAESTDYQDGVFTNLALSSGQRKRLAMVVLLLEDRPVLVLDEWAADQDPEFREYFYRELLPELREQGKTVVAISHDDRYFQLADEIWRMRDGQLEIVPGGDHS